MPKVRSIAAMSLILMDMMYLYSYWPNSIMIALDLICLVLVVGFEYLFGDRLRWLLTKEVEAVVRYVVIKGIAFVINLGVVGFADERLLSGIDVIYTIILGTCRLVFAFFLLKGYNNEKSRPIDDRIRARNNVNNHHRNTVDTDHSVMTDHNAGASSDDDRSDVLEHPPPPPTRQQPRIGRQSGVNRQRIVEFRQEARHHHHQARLVTDLDQARVIADLDPNNNDSVQIYRAHSSIQNRYSAFGQLARRPISGNADAYFRA